MGTPFVAYATAMAQGLADENYALALADAAQNNAWATASVAYVSGTAPLEYQAKVNADGTTREFVQGETGRQNTRRLGEANAYKPYDIAQATKVRDQAVGNATADGPYYVGLAELAGGNAQEVTLTWSVGRADANVASKSADRDVTIAWTTSIVAGDGVYESGAATGAKTLLASLSAIDQDQTLGKLPYHEAQTVANAAAQADYWTAKVTAANARRLGEANAWSSWNTADLTQQAVAIGSIASAVNLPWADSQAAIAGAKSAWWIASGSPNLLAQTAASNAADATYQMTVNAAWNAWAAQTAAAEKTRH